MLGWISLFIFASTGCLTMLCNRRQEAPTSEPVAISLLGREEPVTPKTQEQEEPLDAVFVRDGGNSPNCRNDNNTVYFLRQEFDALTTLKDLEWSDQLKERGFSSNRQTRAAEKLALWRLGQWGRANKSLDEEEADVEEEADFLDQATVTVCFSPNLQKKNRWTRDQLKTELKTDQFSEQNEIEALLQELFFSPPESTVPDQNSPEEKETSSPGAEQMLSPKILVLRYTKTDGEGLQHYILVTQEGERAVEFLGNERVEPSWEACDEIRNFCGKFVEKKTKTTWRL